MGTCVGLCSVWCGAKTIHSLPCKIPKLTADLGGAGLKDDVAMAANTGLESPCVDTESVSSIMQSDGMGIPSPYHIDTNNQV